jgi:hypothetical protein
MASRRRSEFLICPSRGSRSRQTSYIEGQNLTTEYRFAEEQYQRLPELAVDLVGRHAALIVARMACCGSQFSKSLYLPILMTCGVPAS